MSLLTTQDVAALLQVSPKKVRELIHARALQAEDISPKAGRSTYRIDPDELRAFRQRQQVIPEEQVRRRQRIQSTPGRVIEFMK